MMITQSINLNLIPGGVLPRINVSQYDKGSRILQFVLFDGPVLYSIESGTEITIQGSKPDNTAFQYDCTWQGSTVSMDIEQQMTAVAGDVICELVISNNGEILGTCNFILNVESAAVSDDTVISETELPLIERAVEAAVEAAASAASAAQSAEDASGYVETVETAAQNAAQSATDASSSAGTAQTAAQNAAQSATDASSSAGTAQTAAQNAAQSATDASSSAGTAQTAAQNAAQSATDASGSASSASQSATDAAASAQAAAQSAASIGIATTSHAGIVKPDGTTITVDPDGTIHGNASVTVDSALSSSSVNPVQNKVITSALGKVKAIIAPVETDPATNAWAVGRQIIFNDNLYEVITAITAGDALVAYEDDPTNANIKLADPVETQLLDLKDNYQSVKLYHNIPRLVPKDVTSYITDGTFYKRLAGTDGFELFEDLYVGDYIQMSRAISAYEQTQTYQATGSQYVTIAGLDTRMGDGDGGDSVSVINYHHAVMVPGQGFVGTQHFGRSRMNGSNDTSGGYVGSEMFITTIGPVATSGSTATTASINQQLYAEFGSHLKTIRQILSNAMDGTRYNRFGQAGGASSGWAWTTVQAVLMSEVEVYGSVAWSSSGYDTGNGNIQLPLFQHNKQAMNNHSAYYWLKDVASSAYFCICSNAGSSNYSNASNAHYYVRPRFILA